MKPVALKKCLPLPLTNLVCASGSGGSSEARAVESTAKGTALTSIATWIGCARV